MSFPVEFRRTILALHIIATNRRCPLDKRPPLNHQQCVLALQLFEIGAVKIARPDEEGFSLKLHELQPEAPKSPIYFNLRTADNPKPGPLTAEVLRAIVWQLQFLSRDLEYDLVVPVPNAGQPLAQGFVEATPFRMRLERKPLVRMIKYNRAIIGVRTEDIPHRRALLIDDVITGADSMLEAIVILERHGIVLDDCLALIDREQGGAAILREAGVVPHTVYLVTELLTLYVEQKRIEQSTANRVLAYIAANQMRGLPTR